MLVVFGKPGYNSIPFVVLLDIYRKKRYLDLYIQMAEKIRVHRDLTGGTYC
jgi:hypothetical protein